MKTWAISILMDSQYLTKQNNWNEIDGNAGSRAQSSGSWVSKGVKAYHRNSRDQINLVKPKKITSPYEAVNFQ